MDEGLKGWLYKQAYKNLWRIQEFYELDDLIQDGYYIYSFVRNRYPTAVEPKHIMSLFKLCFRSHLANLTTGRKNTYISIIGKTKAEPVEWLSPGALHSDWRHEYAQEVCCDWELIRVIIEAPEHLKKLLKEVVKDPKQLRALLRRRLKGGDETFNDRLCAIAGVSPDRYDLEKDLREYLGG